MDLSIVKIANAHEDNERLIIRVENDCDLGWYMVFDSTYDEQGIQSNKLRHLYILPSLKVAKGDYIWIHTCKGEYHTHDNTSKTKTHNLYWGLDSKVWNNDKDKAYLVKYSDWVSKVVVTPDMNCEKR